MSDPSQGEDTRPGADHMLILDGNNVVMRSLFGMANAALVGPNGVPTGGVFGTINVFRSLVARMHPTHMLWTFDSGKSTMRTALYPEYKANRKPIANAPGIGDVGVAKDGTVSAVKTFLNLAGVAHFSEPGVEADDLIANAVDRLAGKMTITIASADHDLRQLCSADGSVRVLKPSTNQHQPDTLYDYAKVFHEYGLPAERCPEIWAIQGDTSDNIKGVPGLGPKRALKIIQQWGSLSNALMNEPKLQGHFETVRRNLKLISLQNPDDYLPEGLEQCRLPEAPYDPVGLELFLREWGFNSLTDMVTTGRLWL